MSSFTPFVAPQWSLSPSLPLARAECYKLRFLYSVFPMACSGACYEMIGVMEYAPYSSGAKYCSGCGIYLLTSSRTCPCCSVRLRTKPKKRKND